MNPILIVDDEKDNLDALFRIFRPLYDVTTTTSPFEALKLIQQKRFHVIISDQRMPEMTGVELLEKAKQVAPDTVRILLTGYTDVDSVIDAINRGHIYRYIAKPWDPDDLKITIRQADETYLIRTQLDDKTQKLEKAYRDLQSLDRMKSRFLSLVSHELNTPLTILASFMSILKDNQSGFSNDVKKAVMSLDDATNRLSEIVSEVVSYVKLQAEITLHKTKVEMLPLTKEVLKSMKERMEKRKLKIGNLEGGVISVKGDLDRLRIAMEKVVYDVLHRAKADSELAVKFVKIDEKCQWQVSYQGAPIEKEAFAPFDPTSNVIHHQRNLGLALATARAIVEEHGGKMFASQGAHQIVGFELPLDLDKLDKSAAKD